MPQDRTSLPLFHNSLKKLTGDLQRIEFSPIFVQQRGTSCALLPAAGSPPDPAPTAAGVLLRRGTRVNWRIIRESPSPCPGAARRPLRAGHLRQPLARRRPPDAQLP